MMPILLLVALLGASAASEAAAPQRARLRVYVVAAKPRVTPVEPLDLVVEDFRRAVRARSDRFVLVEQVEESDVAVWAEDRYDLRTPPEFLAGILDGSVRRGADSVPFSVRWSKREGRPAAAAAIIERLPSFVEQLSRNSGK